MTIRAVIFDISGTILNRQGQLVSGIQAVIAQLHFWNIDVFFATNNLTNAVLLQSMLPLEWSRFLFPQRVGGKKGTRQFIKYVCSSLQLAANAILYVGDAVHDFYEACNSNVLFFRAAWANPILHYGIPVDTPSDFLTFVQTFFLKEALWYYSIEEKDDLGRDVQVRALLDSDLAKVTSITPFIKSNGTTNKKLVKGFQNGRYLTFHLLASMYLEGLHLKGGSEGSIWCLYPGHDGQYGTVLNAFITLNAALFHNQHQRQLIVRHSEASSSSQIRIKHGNPTIDIQLQTIHLNPALRAEIMHRSIIVLDDFTTNAYGFETARNFLLNAGASSVISIAVGKYGKTYDAFYPKSEVCWDSFLPAPLCEDDFSFTGIAGHIDQHALHPFTQP